MRLSHLGIFSVVFVSGLTAVQAETLGRLRVDDLVASAAFTLSEPFTGAFSLGESSVSVAWDLEKNVSSRIRLGSREWLNQPSIYAGANPKDFGFYEAYAQYQGVYGRLRFGLIPLNVGIEGRRQEAELDLNRSLVFTRGLIGLRDFGASYFVSHNGFYTEIVVHNGEGPAAGNDGRMWYTANWGWENGRSVDVGLSGQAGSTKPEATTGSLSTVAGFNPSQPAEWTQGLFYVHWHPNAYDFRLEVFGGEMDQLKKTRTYHGGHVDFGYRFSPRVKVWTRYDILDPHHRQEGDKVREVTAGVVLRNTSQTSALLLFGTKVLEETQSVANDRLLILWQLTPNI